MSKSLSLDLRLRVVAAVEADGLSHREAADRFKVSAASVSRWRALARQKGEPRPGPLGGDRKTHVIEAHAATILEVFQARRDMSLEELRAELSAAGLSFGYGTLWRFFHRRGWTRKTYGPPRLQG
jgi:transposase